jgi:outer membrane protein
VDLPALQTEDDIMKFWKFVLPASALLTLGFSAAVAKEPGTWTLYAGVGSVNPHSEIMSFTVPGGEFGDITVGFEVDRATSMTFGGTYMFNENWALDILAAWPFTHDIHATVEMPGASGSSKIGEVKQLPPTVSVQYHFTTRGQFDPYIGIGLNYTRFYDEKFARWLVDEGFEKIRLDNSIGFAAQFGGEWALDENWLFAVDVRYVDISADGTLEGDAFAAPDGSLGLGTIDIDPWVYSANIGYQFR